MTSDKKNKTLIKSVNKKYKLNGLGIDQSKCSNCVRLHSILTCEMYKGSIPDDVLQCNDKCKYYRSI